MNQQTEKKFVESNIAAPVVEVAEPTPLTPAQKERMDRIKSAMNRSARERRKASLR